MDGDQRYVELLKRRLVDLLGSHTSRAVAQESGAVVIEDVPEAECRRTVDEFRSREGIDDEMTSIDWTGVVWSKRSA